MLFRREVLQITSGISEAGNVRWELALCLLLAWGICYICIFRGVRTTGKVCFLQTTTNAAPVFNSC